MKKYFIISLILMIVSLTFFGCSTGNQGNNETQKEANQVLRRKIDGEKLPFDEEIFLETDIDDLEIGATASVMGTENQDGSVVADRIMIGNNENDLRNIFDNMQTGVGRGVNEVDSADGNMPNFDDQRPNFEQFQNLSPEERTKLREEMMASGMGRGVSSVSAQGIARLNGEIISKDDMSVTLKLEGGGSKLVFFSNITKVLKIKE